MFSVIQPLAARENVINKPLIIIITFVTCSLDASKSDSKLWLEYKSRAKSHLCSWRIIFGIKLGPEEAKLFSATFSVAR